MNFKNINLILCASGKDLIRCLTGSVVVHHPFNREPASRNLCVFATCIVPVSGYGTLAANPLFMHLILLHGALGSASQFSEMAKMLADHRNVRALDFAGHGGTPFPDDKFSIALFAEQTIQWMEKNRIEKADFLGYSMGGYVALYIARHFPGRVRRIFTLATKFGWTTEIAEREIGNLEPVKLEQKQPDFADALKKLHGEKNWKNLLKKTGELLLDIGSDNPLKEADYKNIAHPVTVCVGDRDRMVSLDETTAVYKQLSNAALLVLPGTGHPLEAFDTEMVAFHVKRFIDQD